MYNYIHVHVCFTFYTIKVIYTILNVYFSLFFFHSGRTNKVLDATDAAQRQVSEMYKVSFNKLFEIGCIQIQLHVDLTLNK